MRRSCRFLDSSTTVRSILDCKGDILDTSTRTQPWLWSLRGDKGDYENVLLPLRSTIAAVPRESALAKAVPCTRYGCAYFGLSSLVGGPTLLLAVVASDLVPTITNPRGDGCPCYLLRLVRTEGCTRNCSTPACKISGQIYIARPTFMWLRYVLGRVGFALARR